MDLANIPILQRRKIRPRKGHVTGCVWSRLEAGRRLDSRFADSCSGLSLCMFGGVGAMPGIRFREASQMQRPIFLGQVSLAPRTRGKSDNHLYLINSECNVPGDKSGEFFETRMELWPGFLHGVLTHLL